MTLTRIILPTEHLTIGLPKLPCASCYVQVLCDLLCAGCSAQAAALCASCSAQMTSHTSFLIEKFHYAAGAAKLYSAYYSCTWSRKASADQAEIDPATARLREQPRKPRDNFQRPLRTQQIRTAPRSSQRVARAYSELKNLSFCTSTTPIPAEGSSWSDKKLRTFYDCCGARATLCGDSCGRGQKTEGFLRF